MRIGWIGMCALGATVLAGPAMARNFIKTGNFERPKVTAANSYERIASPGQKLGRWNVVGNAGSVALLGKNYASGQFNPALGNQSLYMTGVVVTPTVRQSIGLSQTILLRRGISYKLGFWLGNVASNTRGATVVAESAGRGTLLTATNTATDPDHVVWQYFTADFVAPGGAVTLYFTNKSLESGAALLDGITVTPVS